MLRSATRTSGKATCTTSTGTGRAGRCCTCWASSSSRSTTGRSTSASRAKSTARGVIGRSSGAGSGSDGCGCWLAVISLLLATTWTGAETGRAVGAGSGAASVGAGAGEAANGAGALSAAGAISSAGVFIVCAGAGPSARRPAPVGAVAAVGTGAATASPAGASTCPFSCPWPALTKRSVTRCSGAWACGVLRTRATQTSSSTNSPCRPMLNTAAARRCQRWSGAGSGPICQHNRAHQCGPRRNGSGRDSGRAANTASNASRRVGTGRGRRHIQLAQRPRTNASGAE